MARSDTHLIATILFLFFAAVAATAWLFLVREEYDFFVEAPCDSTQEICFVRDCSNPDDCPPNGLSEYTIFKIKAADFNQCADGTCKKECAFNSISCERIVCGDAPEDECTQSTVES